MRKLKDYLRRLNNDAKDENFVARTTANARLASSIAVIEFIINDLQKRIDMWEGEVEAKNVLRSLLNDLTKIKIIAQGK
jgi:hypothetical protein